MNAWMRGLDRGVLYSWKTRTNARMCGIYERGGFFTPQSRPGLVLAKERWDPAVMVDLRRIKETQRFKSPQEMLLFLHQWRIRLCGGVEKDFATFVRADHL